MSSNEAVTALAPDIVTAHAPVPEQDPPLQPANLEPATGVAVSVTTVPAGKGALQAAPQLMPAGEETTVPEPVPARVTERV
jgi:hypothetical protein